MTTTNALSAAENPPTISSPTTKLRLPNNDGVMTRVAAVPFGCDEQPEGHQRGGDHRVGPRRPAQVAPLDERHDQQRRTGGEQAHAERSRRALRSSPLCRGRTHQPSAEAKMPNGTLIRKIERH